MQPSRLALPLLAAFLAACGPRAELASCPHRGAAYAPPVFGSLADAEDYIRVLSFGGAMAMLDTGSQPVLVVYVFGARVPDFAIAVYRPAGGQWVRAGEWGGGYAEAHVALVERGAVVVVGGTSGQRCVLLKAGGRAE